MILLSSQLQSHLQQSQLESNPSNDNEFTNNANAPKEEKKEEKEEKEEVEQEVSFSKDKVKDNDGDNEMTPTITVTVSNNRSNLNFNSTEEEAAEEPPIFSCHSVAMEVKGRNENYRMEISHLLGSILAPPLSISPSLNSYSSSCSSSSTKINKHKGSSCGTEETLHFYAGLLTSLTQHHVSLIQQYDPALLILSKATTVHLGLGSFGISPSVTRVEQASLHKERTSSTRKSHRLNGEEYVGDVGGGGGGGLGIVGSCSTLCLKAARKCLFQCMEHQFHSLDGLIQTLEYWCWLMNEKKGEDEEEEEEEEGDVHTQNSFDDKTPTNPLVEVLRLVKEQKEGTVQKLSSFPQLYTLSSLTTLRHLMGETLSHLLSLGLTIFQNNNVSTVTNSNTCTSTITNANITKDHLNDFVSQIHRSSSMCKEQEVYLKGCFPSMTKRGTEEGIVSSTTSFSSSSSPSSSSSIVPPLLDESIMRLRTWIDSISTTVWALEDSIRPRASNSNKNKNNTVSPSTNNGDCHKKGKDTTKHDHPLLSSPSPSPLELMQQEEEFHSWWSNLSISIESLSNLYDSMDATLFQHEQELKQEASRANNEPTNAVDRTERNDLEEYNHGGTGVGVVQQQDEQATEKDAAQRKNKTVIFAGKGQHGISNGSGGDGGDGASRRKRRTTTTAGTNTGRGSDQQGNTKVLVPDVSFRDTIGKEQLLLRELQSRLNKLEVAQEFEVPIILDCDKDKATTLDNPITRENFDLHSLDSMRKVSSTKEVNPFFLGVSGSILNELKNALSLPVEKMNVIESDDRSEE